jgi:hypothetical protein
MKKVKCKQCDCDIYYKYSAIESLNTKKGKEKCITELEQHPNENCNTTIYLTCENNHMGKYFCNIMLCK